MGEVRTVPVTVGIPTWARGERVVGTLERLYACDPRPSEIIVHVDATDGGLERTLAARFPLVRMLSSTHRVGPGGGRHRCILAAKQPFFVSFDDDSWPADSDFFAEVVRLFGAHTDTAVLAATIFHPWEKEPRRIEQVAECVEYTGCGYALRCDVYRRLKGHLDNPIPYGFEETDLAIQTVGAGWGLARCKSLRVYHDTKLQHHVRPDIVSGTIQNTALIVWLRYPVRFIPRGSLQVLNMIYFQVRSGRWRGLMRGLGGIPAAIWHYRQAREPVSSAVLTAYLPRRNRPSAKELVPV